MLSVVSTPIGNLKDITLRAIEILRTCDAIVCEDTRVTGMLLKHLEEGDRFGFLRIREGVRLNGNGKPNLSPQLISFHGYSDKGKLGHILRLLEEGKHLALVSDAGTPGISDPGYTIVTAARERGYKVAAIPGPSAFLVALSISGLPIHHFLYLGFLPLKKGRKTLINSFIQEERTIVFYESVHRIEKTLAELSEALSSQPDRKIVIGRELTKMHEEIVRTTIKDLPKIAKSITKKGEFVIIIGAI